jgi:hypothetical protein
MDDFDRDSGFQLESEKFYSHCLRCGKEISRTQVYADKSLLRCRECNKERSAWSIALYGWFLLGIPVIYFLFNSLFPESVTKLIVEYPLFGYLGIGGLWCAGLVLIERKRGK